MTFNYDLQLLDIARQEST